MECGQEVPSSGLVYCPRCSAYLIAPFSPEVEGDTPVGPRFWEALFGF